MAYSIRRLEYFYATVKDQPGEAYMLLSRLAEADVNLLAFNLVPTGPGVTRLTLFPANTNPLFEVAEEVGLVLEGPQAALIVQGDDRLGALVEVHSKLYNAGINVYASNGVTDGKGLYGYVIYLRPEDLDSALSALDA